MLAQTHPEVCLFRAYQIHNSFISQFLLSCVHTSNAQGVTQHLWLFLAGDTGGLLILLEHQPSRSFTLCDCGSPHSFAGDIDLNNKLHSQWLQSHVFHRDSVERMLNSNLSDMHKSYVVNCRHASMEKNADGFNSSTPNNVIWGKKLPILQTLL